MVDKKSKKEVAPKKAASEAPKKAPKAKKCDVVCKFLCDKSYRGEGILKSSLVEGDSYVEFKTITAGFKIPKSEYDAL